MALITPSNEPCKYIFAYILHDRIIDSWCLGILNIQFNVCHCVSCFDQNFKRLIDLKSQDHQDEAIAKCGSHSSLMSPSNWKLESRHAAT